MSVTLAWPVPEARDERAMRERVPQMTCTLTRRVYVLDATAQCRAAWYQVIYGACAPLRK
jgi:hypothetical protein